MSSKIRDGDLYLANRWSIMGMMSHMNDPKARWSDIGIFCLRKVENDNDEIYVFLLTRDGARKIPLDTLLRDPSLQSAAHRKLIDRNRIIYAREMMDEIAKLAGSNKERADIVMDEYKQKNPNRTGYTSSELIAKILDKAGLLIYTEGIGISEMQEGSLSDSYSEETPLFSRSVQGDRLKSAIAIAQAETADIITQYFQSKPLRTPNDFLSYPTPVNSNNSRKYKGKDFSDIEVTQIRQFPSVDKTHRKGTVDEGAQDYSKSMARRLHKQNQKKQEYKMYKEGTKFIPK